MDKQDRKLLLATGLAVAGLLAFVAATWALNGGAIEGTCEPGRDVRWESVCMLKPNGPGFDIRRDGNLIIVTSNSPRLDSYQGGSYWEPELVVEASSGRVLDDSLAVIDPNETSRLVRSLRVLSAPTKAWPYVDGTPARYEVFNGVRHGVADDAAGIQVGASDAFLSRCVRFGASEEGAPILIDRDCPDAITISDGVSEIVVSEDLSRPSLEHLGPEAREAFTRVIETVEFTDE